MLLHPEYASLNVGSHRKPATTLGAPGLCRQISFWIPAQSNSDDGSFAPARFEDRRKIWKRDIDRFLKNIVEKIYEVDPASLVSDFKKNTSNYLLNAQGTKKCLYLFDHIIDADGEMRPIFVNEAEQQTEDGKSFSYIPSRDVLQSDIPNRYKIVDLQFNWDGVQIRFKAELHNEYWSLGTFVDLTRRIGQPEKAKSLLNEMQSRFLELHCVSRERLKVLETGDDIASWSDRTEADREKLAYCHNFLYEDFWRRFDAEFIEKTLDYQGKSDLTGRIGLKFFDSRGLLVHCPKDNSAHTDGDASELFDPGKTTMFEYARAADDFGSKGDAHTSLNHLDAFWPIISKSGSIGLDNTEYTASRFLNDSVIYVTSLAGEFRGSRQGSPPIKFLILSRSAHRRRLGQLVDSIYLLGNSRVAAVMNIEQLSRSSDAIRDFSRRLNELTTKPKKTSLQENVEELLRRSNLEKLLAISAETADEIAKFDGGIEYRVDRSRYYVDQYTRTVMDLQAQEIPGFRVFNEFVERRLGSTYRFIDRLGDRLDRHKRDLQHFTEEIRTAQSLRLGEQNTAMQRSLLDLQRIAEKLLIVPLTYYTSHVFQAIFKQPYPSIEYETGYIYGGWLLFWTIFMLGRDQFLHTPKSKTQGSQEAS